MPQKYTLAFMKGNLDAKGLCRIYIRVLPVDVRIPTPIKVKPKQFSKKVISHPEAKIKNEILSKCKSEVESKIQEVLSKGGKIDKDIFNRNGSDFKAFVLRHIELNHFSPGRIKQLKTGLNMILEFDSKVSFENINLEWVQKFEKYLRAGRQDATVQSKISMLLSFLNAAEKKDLINKKQYSSYKRLGVKEKIPVYLTESQINDFYEVVKPFKDIRRQSSGYYFLLACYAGYRISDCKAFNYENNVRDGVITIRARKNGEIVSIPVYTRLKEILDYCKENEFIETEQHARESVKQIAKLAGIKFYKDVKFHSGRHSFAMFCLQKGMSKDEVADLLGDSMNIVSVYARITNKQLHESVLNKLN